MSADVSKDINFDVIKDTYIGVLQKYLVINGRARRREFWIFFFCNLVLGLVLSLIPFINIIFGLLTFIPNITVMVRRLHDTNRSGKWLFLGIAPLLGIIFSLAGSVAAVALNGRGGGCVALISGLVFLVSIAVAIILLFWAAQDGTPGDNRYGPNPKSVTATLPPAASAPVSLEAGSVVCSACGKKNPSGTKFCAECGNKLELGQTYLRLRSVLHPAWNFATLAARK